MEDGPIVARPRCDSFRRVTSCWPCFLKKKKKKLDLWGVGRHLSLATKTPKVICLFRLVALRQTGARARIGRR